MRAHFRSGKTKDSLPGKPLTLHRHQDDAIRIAQRREHYALTMLRQVEVLMGQGKVVAEAIRSIDVLADLLITRGVPGHIRSDNGPDAAAAVKGWITGVRQRGYVQSFNGKLRDELPSCEAFSC